MATTSTTKPIDSSTAPGATEIPTGAPPRWRMLSLASTTNLIVFVLLGCLFWFGHHTGWKMPRVSALFGAASAPSDDWCDEHLVPSSICVECRDDLLPRPKEFGFCKIHGVAECVICHPELAQVEGEPRLPKYDTARAIELFARPENNSRNTLHQHRVQFATDASVAKAGIDVDVVGERPMVETVSANGEVLFDPTRVAHLSSRASGTVAYVFKFVGDDVAPGEVLALIDAAAVGQAKSSLLQAIVQRELRGMILKRLKAASDGVAGKTINEAEAALQESEVAFISARQSLVNLGLDVPEEFDEKDAKRVSDQLRFLGIPPETLAKLPEGTRSANLFPVRSPQAGVVVAADVVAGEVVDAKNVLVTIADPKRMWLKLSVRQEDARYVARGQEVVFRADDGGVEVKGRIAWVSPAIDERTRTLETRVNLDNSQGRLKDKSFGTGQVLLREEPNALVVPREAVQNTTDGAFVFVRDHNFLKPGAPKVFYPRQVRIGARDDRYVELLAGVLPGEVVATGGSGVLLAQLLRGNFGEGCGCHPH